AAQAGAAADAGGGQRLAVDEAAEARGERRVGAAVDLARAGGRDGQRGLADAGRRRRGDVGELVVAGGGAADADAADAHGLARARVAVGERGAGVADGEVVAGDAVVRQRDRGGGGAVVDLVHAGGGDREGRLVHHQRASRGTGRVVAGRVGVTDGETVISCRE